MKSSPPHELFQWPGLQAPCTPEALGAYLAHAARCGARAVHLASERPLKFAWGGLLYDASGRPLADGEARALLDGVLDARARAAWARGGAAEGIWSVEAEGKRWRFAVCAERIYLEGGEGVYVILERLPGPPTPWDELALPARLESALGSEGEGLILVGTTAGDRVPDLISSCVQRALDDPKRRQRIVELAGSPGATADYRAGAGTSLRVEPLVEPGHLAEAVRRCLRRPPGLIVVRDIPDRDTFEQVLEAARCGHRVIGGLRAGDVASLWRRALALVPDGYRSAALDALAQALTLAVVGRTLPGLDGSSLPVWEWLAVDSGMRAILRDVEPERAPHAARAWVAGGHSFRGAADELLRQGLITAAAHGDFLNAGGQNG